MRAVTDEADALTISRTRTGVSAVAADRGGGRGRRSRSGSRSAAGRPLADLTEAARQQPRDVHLGDAEPRRDLRLGESFEEPQPQDLLLAGREAGDEGGELGA